MRIKAIIIADSEEQTKKLAACLYADDVDVFCIPTISDLGTCLDPKEKALLLLGVQKSGAPDETNTQIFKLKREYPAAEILIIPALSGDFSFAIQQAIEILRIRQEGGARTQNKAEEVTALIRQLMEKLGPEVSEHIEEVDGVGFRFNHDGPIIEIDTRLLEALGRDLGEDS